MKRGLMKRWAATGAVVVALGACASSQQAAPAANAPAANAPTAAAGGERTVMSGVFTADQGTRGQRVFQTSCASCHNIGEMRGAAWQRTWNNRTLGDFHQFISTQMPLDSPGSLSAQQYTDVIAYLLRENGYPTGTAELAPTPTALAAIRVVPMPN